MTKPHAEYDLADIIQRGESDTIEFKVSFSDMSDILKCICAFANGKGGYVLVGVSDDGDLVGVDVDSVVLERLENMIRETIEPKIYVNISIEAVNDKIIVVIRVPEGINKPYFYRGVCYVRIGTVTRAVSRDGIIEILKSKISFDSLRLEEEVSLREDIIKRLVERARRHRRMKISFTNVEDVLRRLGVYRKRAMALLFSDDLVFPQATIKCGAYKGQEKIDEETIYGNLFEQVERALEFIKRNIRRTYRIEGLERREIWEYPIEALREAIVNAVAHRDYFVTSPIYIRIYEDRVVIQNPGELPPPLTVEMLRKEHPSIPRNPLIAEAFYLWGYIEKWGEGTNRMIEACRNYGLPEPMFESKSGFFTVTLMKREALLRGLSENIKRLYDYIKSRGIATFRECVEFIGKSEKTTQRYLRKLEELGLIERAERGKYKVK